MTPSTNFTRSPYSFLLVVLLLTVPAQAAIEPANPAENITFPYQTFKTVNFTPPALNITHYSSPSEGYYFFAPDGPTVSDLAPLIMDVSGNLIWNGPRENGFSFGVYELAGKDVLAWWNGTLYPEPIGRGNGVIYIYDDSYEKIHEVTLAGNFLEQVPGARFPSNIDLHELKITPNGSIIVTANNVTQADLTSVGGPADGWVVDGLVYVIDIATNEVLFSWSSLDHLDQIPFTDSLYPLGSEGFTGANQSLAWGYFHINSVDPYDSGYLISSRYFCRAFAIDATGHVRWQLSGRTGGDFKLVGSNETTGFCYQHDVRVVNDNASCVTLHMHDNHNSPIENGSIPTTAKSLNLNLDTKEATLDYRYLNASGPTYSNGQGSVRVLPDGNLFVDHGSIPIMEEFSPSGVIISTVQFGAAEIRPGNEFWPAKPPSISYRGFKQLWTGCPKTEPDVVAEPTSAGIAVFVSWNGATDVVAWEIYAGVSSIGLAHVSTVAKSGFETEAHIESANYVQVKPVFNKGSVCGNAAVSSVVAVS